MWKYTLLLVGSLWLSNIIACDLKRNGSTLVFSFLSLGEFYFGRFQTKQTKLNWISTECSNSCWKTVIWNTLLLNQVCNIHDFEKLWSWLKNISDDCRALKKSYCFLQNLYLSYKNLLSCLEGKDLNAYKNWLQW